MPKARIARIEPGSIAEDGGILPGDILISVNNQKLKDIFDYKFLTASEFVTLELMDQCGELYSVDIEKDPYEDIGIEFENPLIDSDRGCANNCIFCFIDQMPQGMRDTLYFKDDDTRLSFLTGNYVTLTNIGKRELDRLIKYRISPINVSVHTTNPSLREYMLGNKKAGDIMTRLKLLSEGNITVNAQIVLCPSINDGDELTRTLNDLYSLKECIYSVSAVPVGITKHRQGLHDLRTYTKEECIKIIDQCEAFAKKAKSETGRSFVYLADEIYVKAEKSLPGISYYDDFPQIENGVGMLTSFCYEVNNYLSMHNIAADNNKIVSIATGYAAYEFFVSLCNELQKQYGFKINVYRIRNDFFGETVTVAGLITGGDLINQLKDKDLGDKLLITRNMLKHGETVFLDDITLEDAEKALNVPVIPVHDSGEEFIANLL